MRKISLNKLRANFSKLILDVMLQLSFTLLVLAITGILVPYTIYTSAVAMIAESIAYALMACNVYFITAYQANRLNMRTAFKDLTDTINNNLTAKNVFQAALMRITAGIIVGIIVGITTYSFSVVSMVLMYVLFPRQFALDIEKQNGFHNDYDITRANIAIHAPVYEEAVHRSLQMSLLKIAMHVVYFLYSAAKELYASLTGKTAVTVVAQANSDIEQTLTTEQSQARELEHIQEQDSTETLNKNVDNSANFVSAVSFSKGHLPTQYPHTFVSGLAFASLANNYGDIVAPVVAHMTHNTLSTMHMS